jgi:hypothetical protein
MLMAEVRLKIQCKISQRWQNVSTPLPHTHTMCKYEDPHLTHILRRLYLTHVEDTFTSS